MKTSSATTNGDKVSIMATVDFQCIDISNLYQTDIILNFLTKPSKPLTGRADSDRIHYAFSLRPHLCGKPASCCAACQRAIQLYFDSWTWMCVYWWWALYSQDAWPLRRLWTWKGMNKDAFTRLWFFLSNGRHYWNVSSISQNLTRFSAKCC